MTEELKETDKCMVWGCKNKPTRKVFRESIIFIYCDKHFIKYGAKIGYSNAKL